MSFDESAFVQGIVSGRIRPAKVRQETDKFGQPLTIYDFPDYECAVHAHFEDVAREVVAPSHIKMFAPGSHPIPIDNRTLAMLRHHAEEAVSSSPRRRRRHRVAAGVFLIGVAVSVYYGLPALRAYQARSLARQSTVQMGELRVRLAPDSIVESPTSLVIKVSLGIATEQVKKGYDSEKLTPIIANASSAVASHLSGLSWTSTAIYPFASNPRVLLGHFSTDASTADLKRELIAALDAQLAADGLPHGLVSQAEIEVISPQPPQVFAVTIGAERSQVLHSAGSYYFMEPNDEWEVFGTYTFDSGRYRLGSTPTWFRVRRGEARYFVDPTRVRLKVRYR